MTKQTKKERTQERSLVWVVEKGSKYAGGDYSVKVYDREGGKDEE